jgi:ABC-2 type transport system permease protein
LTQRIVRFVRVVLARAYPRLVGLTRMPGWMVIETVMPALSVCALALAYRAMNAPEQYLGFAVLGGAMTAFWLNVIWSMGAQLHWDREAGNLELYILSPCSMMAVLAGMALGGMCMTMIRASTIVLVGWLVFAVPFAPSSWLLVILVFLLLLLALYGLGMVFSVTFLWWGRQALHLVNLLQEPVFLLSGLSFPVRVLGPVVSTIAAVLPLTAGVDALRQLLFPSMADQGLMPVWVEACLLAGLACLFLFLARWLLRLVEQQARAGGRLTVRWM